MTITQRVVALVLIAISTLAAVSGIALWSQWWENRRLENLVDVVAPRVAKVGEVGNLFRDLRTELVMLMLEPDADLKQKLGEHAGKSADRVAAVVKEYEKLADDQAPGGKLAAVRTAWTTYKTAFTETVSGAVFGDDDRAVNDFYAKVVPASNGMQKALDALLQDDMEAQRRAKEQLEHASRQAQVAVAAIGATAFIALALSGFMTVRSVKAPLEALRESVRKTAQDLDLTRRIAVTRKDEVGQTVAAFNGLLETLQSSFQDVAQLARDVAQQAGAVAAGADRMASGARVSSDAASGMAAAVEEVSVSIDHMADRASEVSERSRNSRDMAQSGAKVVEGTIAHINRISEQMDDATERMGVLANDAAFISQVVAVIRDVAERTNLLALNAAIEAARAGEQGRGFAVVADEVRKLAERTTSATAEIGQLVTRIQASTTEVQSCFAGVVVGVQEGVGSASQAGSAIEGIRTGSNEAVIAVEDVSAAIREQSVASHDIAKSVETVARMSDELNGVAASTAGSAASLKDLSDALLAAADRYRIRA